MAVSVGLGDHRGHRRRVLHRGNLHAQLRAIGKTRGAARDATPRADPAMASSALFAQGRPHSLDRVCVVS